MIKTMGKKEVKIGLLGLGTIGGGAITLLLRNGGRIKEQFDVKLTLERVLERDLSRAKAVGIDEGMLTIDPALLLEDPEIDIVIELIGGIEPARTFISTALKNGKYVVTANKDLMATHGRELLALAAENKRNIFYEASVGGGIPLIRPLKHSLVGDRVVRLVGIVNGTTNYIFTRMANDDLTLQEALLQAQELGFAESDPTNDIEGLDAAYKLAVMAGLAFGKSVDPGRIYVRGISAVTHEDIAYARELGYVVKLLAIGEDLNGQLALRVHPALVPVNHPLAAVQNEFNAIFIEGEAVGELMFYGKGAGAMPTATAVVADLVEAARSICSGLNNGVMERARYEQSVVPVESLHSRFYLRLLAQDRPGVFASLANAFGDEQVSLDMIIQKRRVDDLAEIVLVTHDVVEKSFNNALDKLMQLPAIQPNPSIIRLLG